MRRSPADSDDWRRVSRVNFPLPESLAAIVSDDRRTRVIAAAVGVLSLSAAVVVGTGLGGERAVSAVSSFVSASRGVLTVVAVIAAVGAVWSFVATVDNDAADGFRLPPPAEEAVDESTVVGAEFDYSLDRSIDSAPDWWHGVGVGEEVQSLALTVLRTEAGYELDPAVRALETGTWTDDPRAATYLGVESHRPARMRLRDWIRGDAERRQVEATLRELTRIAGVEDESADFERRGSGPSVSDLRGSDDEEVSLQ